MHVHSGRQLAAQDLEKLNRVLAKLIEMVQQLMNQQQQHDTDTEGQTEECRVGAHADQHRDKGAAELSQLEQHQQPLELGEECQ